MKRQFARVKGVLHSFHEDVPDLSICGVERSKRTKLYDEPPKGVKRCKTCDEAWLKFERDGAVQIEMQVGDMVILKSGTSYVVEEVGPENIYCRRRPDGPGV